MHSFQTLRSLTFFRRGDFIDSKELCDHCCNDIPLKKKKKVQHSVMCSKHPLSCRVAANTGKFTFLFVSFTTSICKNFVWVNVEYVLLSTTKSNTREETSFSVLDYNCFSRDIKSLRKVQTSYF